MYNTNTNNKIIVAENLAKSFGKKKVFEGFNLAINENQIIGLIGANGSGKTTFFNMCIGNENLTGGKLNIMGGNPAKDMNVRENIVYSAPALPVAKEERIRDVLKYYKISYPNFDLEFAKKLLEVYKLNPKSQYKTLSTGMKSMFHFTCAIATRSKVTFLDEPFNGMDIENRKLSYEILLRDYCENPRTIMISSHNLEEMENLLSEMVLIQEGKLVFYEDMDTVREMLICVSAGPEKLEKYSKVINQPLIVKKISGTIGGDKLIIKRSGEEGSEAVKIAKELALEISPVSPEDVCVYLTGEDKEEKINGLWQE